MAVCCWCCKRRWSSADGDVVVLSEVLVLWCGGVVWGVGVMVVWCLCCFLRHASDDYGDVVLSEVLVLWFCVVGVASDIQVKVMVQWLL